MGAGSSDTSWAEIQRVRDKWLEAREDHSRLVWGEEYRRLSKKERLEQETGLHAEATHGKKHRNNRLVVVFSI